ncbi:MAG TPA: hypothetical protein VE753_04550 [Gaiellaceae bacterium]|nr:hypothetical protein [Gaiellaceae bacterium]
MPEAEVRVRDAKALRTQGGNVRFVLVDDEGREYSTFKQEIAAALPGLEGRRVRIEYHEQQRGRFTNVYLDAVEPLDEPAPAAASGDADEVAWKTAIDAAPYLLSEQAVEEEVAPEELFEKLQPFKELVADDIESEDDSDRG